VERISNEERRRFGAGGVRLRHNHGGEEGRVLKRGDWLGKGFGGDKRIQVRTTPLPLGPKRSLPSGELEGEEED